MRILDLKLESTYMKIDQKDKIEMKKDKGLICHLKLS